MNLGKASVSRPSVPFSVIAAPSGNSCFLGGGDLVFTASTYFLSVLIALLSRLYSFWDEPAPTLFVLRTVPGIPIIDNTDSLSLSLSLSWPCSIHDPSLVSFHVGFLFRLMSGRASVFPRFPRNSTLGRAKGPSLPHPSRISISSAASLSDFLRRRAAVL